MNASEPCYNGTIYDRNFANEKISRINFCDFAQIAKVKPRKIFPLYGIEGRWLEPSELDAKGVQYGDEVW